MTTSNITELLGKTVLIKYIPGLVPQSIINQGAPAQIVGVHNSIQRVFIKIIPELFVAGTAFERVRCGWTRRELREQGHEDNLITWANDVELDDILVYLNFQDFSLKENSENVPSSQ